MSNARELADYPNSQIVTKNYIINGDMSVWQRGTSFSLSATHQFTADRWSSFSSSGTTTLTRDGTPPGGISPLYALRAQNASGVSSVKTPIELHSTGLPRPFYDGKRMVLSFYVKCDANGAGNVGTVIGYWRSDSQSATGQGTAFSTSYTENNSGSWQRYVIPITIDASTCTTGHTCLTIVINFPASSQDASITGVMLEDGETPTRFHPAEQTFAGELAACQRYYCKSFEYTVAPAENVGSYTGCAMALGDGSTGGFLIATEFPVKMRATPTITKYNPQAANNYARNSNDGTDTAVTNIISSRDVHFVHSTIDATDAGDRMNIHWAADAEL